jgi:hypothetical protein
MRRKLRHEEHNLHTPRSVAPATEDGPQRHTRKGRVEWGLGNHRGGEGRSDRRRRTEDPTGWGSLSDRGGEIKPQARNRKWGRGISRSLRGPGGRGERAPTHTHTTPLAPPRTPLLVWWSTPQMGVSEGRSVTLFTPVDLSSGHYGEGTVKSHQRIRSSQGRGGRS